MSKSGYYAVLVGREPGIYNTWEECQAQVNGYPNNKFKKFSTKKLALEYLESSLSLNEKCKVTKFNSDSSSPEKIPILNDAFKSISEPETPKLISRSSSSRKAYYAVHRGEKPGIYSTWKECQAQIKGFKNPSYRKFDNEEEAIKYMQTGGIVKATREDIKNLQINNQIKKRKYFNNDLDINDASNYVLKDPNEVVVIFTDGASSKNGKQGAQAGIGVYWGPDHPLNTSQRLVGRQTNNRAEIHAAIHALNQARQIGAKNIKLYTDSQFLIHGITDWINKWKINGWKLASGQPVINKEDFIQLDAARRDLNVEWIYVRAHAKNKGNEEADRLAVAGAQLLNPRPKKIQKVINDTNIESELNLNAMKELFDNKSKFEKQDDDIQIMYSSF